MINFVGKWNLIENKINKIIFLFEDKTCSIDNITGKWIFENGILSIEINDKIYSLFKKDEYFINNNIILMKKSDKTIKISIIVPCMGRLEHLKQTLPTLINIKHTEYILVDWSCPNESYKYAKQFNIKICNILNEQYFNLARARNSGAMIAEGEWLFFLDADMIFKQDNFFNNLIEILREGYFYSFNEGIPGFCGALLCKKKDFLKIGCYDDNFIGYGYEDVEIHKRLRQILINQKINHNSFLHINHDDNIRTAFYEIKNKKQNEKINYILEQIK